MISFPDPPPLAVLKGGMGTRLHCIQHAMRRPGNEARSGNEASSSSAVSVSGKEGGRGKVQGYYDERVFVCYSAAVRYVMCLTHLWLGHSQQQRRCS